VIPLVLGWQGRLFPACFPDQNKPFGNSISCFTEKNNLTGNRLPITLKQKGGKQHEKNLTLYADCVTCDGIRMDRGSKRG
jgi:hypothetical protein